MNHTRGLILLLIFGGWLGGARSKAGAQVATSGTEVTPLNVASRGTGSLDAPYNPLIVQMIRTMPQAGGYSATSVATARLSAAASLDATGISVQADQATPSYCSGATYLVFLKAVSALQRAGRLSLDDGAAASLLVTGQRDGQGVWGRWNANGPGTARLFHEMGLGTNFTDYAQARPGDFMKIFWSTAVGKRERGHSVIFLGEETVGGVAHVRFWSSNQKDGYGEKTVPKTKIAAVIFSRLTRPANLARAAAFQTAIDPYLASLLSKESSLAEAHRLCGM